MRQLVEELSKQRVSLREDIFHTHQQELINSIRKTDQQYSTTPSPELYKERLNLKAQYDLLSTQKTEQQLLWSKGCYYEHGEKASRLLDHQLKCKSASRMIPQIRNSPQESTIDPFEINDAFKRYYVNLHTLEFLDNNLNMLDFLSNLDIPMIKAEFKDHLEESLQLQEIINSIKSMQNNKTPEPDGYPVEFYKKFSTQLSPVLLEMFEQSMSQATLPSSLTEASITLLLKPGKDPLTCSSY